MTPVAVPDIETPHAAELRLLWRVSLAVFVVTVAIGLFNGQRIGTLDPQAERPLLLTHLHTGAIGWVSINVIAMAIWLFSAGRGATNGVGTLARFVAAAVGIYPIVFFLFYPGGLVPNAAILGVFGTLALIGIVWALVWTIGQAGQTYLSVARLAALGAVFNLALGAILGVLVEARFAGLEFPGNVNQAHPAMMTVGYLLPAAFAFVEWRLGGGIEGRRSIAGTIAVALLILGGWLIVYAAITNQPQLFAPTLLFQLVAAVILLVRTIRRIVGARWLEAAGERHVAITALAVVVDVALLMYAVMAFFSQQLEPPRALFIAIAHVEFVLMMTNSVFATLLLATAGRRATVWPWADHVVFWGMNLGAIGFVLVELTGQLGLVALVTPIMGISILIGIAAFAMRLGGADESVPSTAAAA